MMIISCFSPKTFGFGHLVKSSLSHMVKTDVLEHSTSFSCPCPGLFRTWCWHQYPEIWNDKTISHPGLFFLTVSQNFYFFKNKNSVCSQSFIVQSRHRSCLSGVILADKCGDKTSLSHPWCMIERLIHSRNELMSVKEMTQCSMWDDAWHKPSSLLNTDWKTS